VWEERIVGLIPLDEASRGLRLVGRSYLGIREIPVDRIVGSVDRSADFGRDFRPPARPFAQPAGESATAPCRRSTSSRWAVPTSSRTGTIASPWRGNARRVHRGDWDAHGRARPGRRSSRPGRRIAAAASRAPDDIAA
jgi:hypothetical protein